MKSIIRLLLSALSVILISKILSHVSVDSYKTALIVAAVIGLLNFIVRPIITFLTLPITILTFGLFSLVINAAIILLADHFIEGFSVDGFWWALLFSLMLSFFQYILFSLFKSDKKKQKRIKTS